MSNEKKQLKYVSDNDFDLVKIEGGTVEYRVSELPESVLSFVMHFGFKKLLQNKTAGMGCVSIAEHETCMSQKYDALLNGETTKAKLSTGDKLVKFGLKQLEAGLITKQDFTDLKAIAKKMN